MQPTKQQPTDDQNRDEKKRQKWQDDYLDAVDLREANAKQLTQQDDAEDKAGE